MFICFVKTMLIASSVTLVRSRESFFLPAEYTSNFDDAIDIAVEEVFQPREIENSVDPWRMWLDLPEEDLTSSIQKTLSNPALWESWRSLHRDTRDVVVRKFLPSLLGDRGWTIHCSDAYRLCEADSSCAWKFWNFVSSCPTAKSSVAELSITSQWDNVFKSLRKTRSVRKRLRNRGKKRARSRNGRRRNRMKKRRQYLSRINRAKQRRRRVKMATIVKTETAYLHYWMGKHWPGIHDKRRDLGGDRCSSKCLEALKMLNNTVYAPLLAKCDCRARSDGQDLGVDNSQDEWNVRSCRKHQLSADLCRPRIYKSRSATIGCTESRIRCENNPKCRRAQAQFLLQCSQVINGVICTPECAKAMGKLQKASRYFNSCICDGAERPICEKIRSNIKELCVKHDCSTNHETTRNGQVVINSTKRCRLRHSDAEPLKNSALNIHGLRMIFFKHFKTWSLSFIVILFLA
ncbi:uncharacterized protein LOC143445147 [Clavelina lepadiformis]|uniref:uncharacterized protein LOC143445147 n=1 Tax=Clavelina lepadiformis TaxID=159417 RepID=UPI00404258E6